MPESFVAVHLDAVPAGPDRGPGIAELRPVRRHLGIEAFGANARVARAAGEVLVMPHDERSGGPYGTDGHEELYVVLRGRARFTVAGEDVDAPAGTLLFVGDPAAVRSAVALEAGTAVLGIRGPPGAPPRGAPLGPAGLGIGAPPGAPYRVAPWEQRDVEG